MSGIVFCAFGGACGALMRYWLSGVVYRHAGASFPWGTMAVNLIGALLIGILWALFESSIVTANLRMFLFIGFLGAFTTFSTFALENFHLIRDGQFIYALANVVLSNVLGIILVFAGYFLVKQIQTIIQ